MALSQMALEVQGSSREAPTLCHAVLGTVSMVPCGFRSFSFAPRLRGVYHPLRQFQGL